MSIFLRLNEGQQVIVFSINGRGHWPDLGEHEDFSAAAWHHGFPKLGGHTSTAERIRTHHIGGFVF